MARRYSAIGAQSAALTDTILTIVGATTTRASVYEVLFGSTATPADQAFKIACQRFAGGAGTGTAVARVAWDAQDCAATSTAFQLLTVEPTYVSGLIPLQFSINQQATFRWVVLPQYGIIMPAAADGGLGACPLVVTGGTPALDMQFTWEE